VERTVPSTASEEVELYLRTYYSLLRSTAEVKIRTLEEAHAGMNSLLHPSVRGTKPDMGAFIYTLLRTPKCMPEVRLVVLGQSTDVFTRAGFENIENWEEAPTAARRRRSFYNGVDTLASIIASRSDIDDLIPILTAFQIEWNKLHHLLQPVKGFLRDFQENEERWPYLADALEVSMGDLLRLSKIWGDEFAINLGKIAESPRSLSVQLLNGSLSEYRRATHAWWSNIEQFCPELRTRPVYYISSNTHSVINLITGFALQFKEMLTDFLNKPENISLADEWEEIQSRDIPYGEENFLYYVLKKFQQSNHDTDLFGEQLREEQGHGIIRIPAEHYFDVEAQIIDLSRVDTTQLDPRLQDGDLSFLVKSDALILNLDYPLGLAAYNILTEISEHVREILGVYIMGKAATLNGIVGDVMIPNVIHDEQSANTFIFPNTFSSADVSPYLLYGTVLDNQKAVSVRGTFLQNANYMDVFYREGYTDIEMEAGPYLSAVYEMYRPKRHPVNEIVNLYGLPFDLGIIHYASDTPLSKGKNLGAGSLSYYGMDSTYAASLAVLRQIITQERSRIK